MDLITFKLIGNPPKLALLTILFYFIFKNYEYAEVCGGKIQSACAMHPGLT